ncbi:MAG: PAS domain-containing protein [Desulfobacterales bacterium]|nr:MAG: PAS domain-containing protein [Desulfobacterales bacterium]
MNQKLKTDKNYFYKISISIAAGLIGFWFNFHPFSSSLPPYHFSFQIGLVFPMIISLQWGWTYGLLSSTFGLGCQTMWFKGGWESVVAVSMFTLWIVWHGWCAAKFRKTRQTKWNSYVTEIPFRLFNILILFTIFRWAFGLNPAPWAPEMTKVTIPISLINYAAAEATINGYLVLLLADILIIFGPVRKLFHLKIIQEQKQTNYLLTAAILISCIYWIIDSAYYKYIFFNFPNSMVFNKQKTLIDLLFFNVPPYTLFVRISFFIAILTGVLLASKFMSKYRETENFLRKIVELSPYPIVVIESDGRVEYANPTFVQTFGYALDEIPTVTEWFNKIFPNVFDRREFILNWKEDLKKAKTQAAEPRMFDAINKDGKVQNIIFRQVFVENDKEVIICEIVSERVQAENNFRTLHDELEQRVIQRTAQLEAINKELEAFSYSVSHDLRAPLRSIDGFSMALLEEYSDKLDLEGQDYLQRVRSASQRMGQIIDDLLSLSRISRRELRKQDVNLSEIAENILTKLQERDPERTVDIVLGHKVVAYCDPNLVEIVLENLLSNAWKFTTKQEKPWIVFDQIIQDNEMVYCVRDNGAGFDMAYADKLFGTFQRLHKDTDFDGYGIGLATVQRIINRHEGRIWAEGYVNRGASFYFVI